MFKLIGSIFKYSILVLVILVLSHIIQIKGVSVSDHVKALMNLTTKASPQNILKDATQELQVGYQNRLEQIKAIDPEINPEDQKALQSVIERAQK